MKYKLLYFIALCYLVFFTQVAKGAEITPLTFDVSEIVNTTFKKDIRRGHLSNKHVLHLLGWSKNDDLVYILNAHPNEINTFPDSFGPINYTLFPAGWTVMIHNIVEDTVPWLHSIISVSETDSPIKSQEFICPIYKNSVENYFDRMECRVKENDYDGPKDFQELWSKGKNFYQNLLNEHSIPPPNDVILKQFPIIQNNRVYDIHLKKSHGDGITDKLDEITIFINSNQTASNMIFHKKFNPMDIEPISASILGYLKKSNHNTVAVLIGLLYGDHHNGFVVGIRVIGATI